MKRSFGREEVVRNCFGIPRLRSARLRICLRTRPRLLIPYIAGRSLLRASYLLNEFLFH